MPPPTPPKTLPGELFRALAVLIEPPTPEHRPIAAALGLGLPPSKPTHTNLFDFQLFPQASVYLSQEGMQGGEAQDRIAGFWRVLELEAPPEPDNLTVLLAAYAALLDRAESDPEPEAEHWQRVSQVFLHEHLLSWLPLFLAKVAAVGDDYYSGWAKQLQDTLASQELGQAGAALPAALREAPGLPDPREEGGKAFLHGLLAPARTGFILTRDDLAELAQGCDLGRRIGERRYVLENLLGQDGPSVLKALADFAEKASRQVWIGMPPVTADWWCQRACQSHRLLEELASATA